MMNKEELIKYYEYDEEFEYCDSLEPDVSDFDYRYLEYGNQPRLNNPGFDFLNDHLFSILMFELLELEEDEVDESLKKELFGKKQIILETMDVLTAIEAIAYCAYSCDSGHSFPLKADSQSRFIRTLVPGQNGHLFQHSFSLS